MPRCIVCGRPIELEEIKPDPYDDDDDMDDIKPRKTPSFCQLCQAKIKNESDKAQKEPKPM